MRWAGSLHNPVRAAQRRPFALALVLAMIAGMFTVLTAPSPAAGAPGNPGVPGDPVQVFAETFEVDQDATASSLGGYVGTAGQSHSADPFWLLTGECNGVIVQYADTVYPTGFCDIATSAANYDNMRNNVRRLADVLGQVDAGVVGGTRQNPVNGSTVQTRANHAVAAFTSTQDGLPNLIQFATSPLGLSASGPRFYTASVDVAELSCDFIGGANNSRLRFAFLIDGDEVPITASDIRACTDSRVRYYTSPDLPGGWVSGGPFVAAGRFHSDRSALLTAEAVQDLRIVMHNRTGAHAGNDAAFDNIRIVDVTPQLDKAFSPVSVPTGGTSTLTLTVTNTSELAEKRGWAFTDALPAGLVIANPANITDTCAANIVAAAGGTQIAVTDGLLIAGAESCQISLDVTSDTPLGGDVSPKVYTNDVDNFPVLNGLNPPGPAVVEFYSTPDLVITKTSDATESSRPGDVVTYTVSATNTGTGDYTAENPAVLFDDLSEVLDDAQYGMDAAATLPGQVSATLPLLSWTGALPVGATVELEYTVTLQPGGDGVVRNVAWVPADPENPVTPACDRPEDGVDPVTGEPCADHEYLLPRLSISKTADRTAVTAVGQEVEYTVIVTNQGPGVYTAAAPATMTDDLTDVLDAADFNGDEVASTGAVTYLRPTLSWHGPLAADESATIRYSVTYTGAGEGNLHNLACVPESETVPDADPCADVVTVAARVTAWKQVQSSDSPVVAGAVLTYTLFFENDGEVAASVDHIDDLTHVIDDADVSAEPTSEDGLVVDRDGHRISITGSVPPGQTLTATYQVTVRADGDRGDDLAANYLLGNKPGDPPVPPAEPVCQPAHPERPDCTLTPIGMLITSKTVTAGATPVEAATVLTYTLTFANQGEGPVRVHHTDVLTDVLDDADLTGNPAASDDVLSASPVSDGRFIITGELAAGTTVTVTYRVTVKEDAARGNNSADNFLIRTGEVPPAECVGADVNCTVTPLPLVAVVKDAYPVSGSAVHAGQEVTYTLTFTNRGEAPGGVDYTDTLTEVLDDADLTGAPVSSDPALVVTTGDDGAVRVTGALEPGQSVTVSYTVTVAPDGQRGDNHLRNLVARTGAVDPDCDDEGVSCTEHPVGELVGWKTVDPPTGSTLRAGEHATYTLHFENTGIAPVEVNRDDVLTQVLDDADITSQPVASSGALIVTEVADGRFTVTGTLQPGQQETVTYQVTVRADGERGDDRLDNFLVPAGQKPPVGPCVPSDWERPDCTYNHVSDVTVTKVSDPVSGSRVNPGEQVTYTVTITNRSANPDAADVIVDYTDHMADVLDDARLTHPPTVSNENLTAVSEGDTIRITGAVPSGETYTVTYTVTVNAYDAQGDHRLSNVVAITGASPVCVVGSLLCTEHDVPKPPPTPVKPALPQTGGEISSTVAIAALLLLAAGGGLLLLNRRRTASAAGRDRGVGLR